MSWIQLELHIKYRQLHLIGDEADWGTFTLLAACAEHKFKKILTKGINTYKQVFRSFFLNKQFRVLLPVHGMNNNFEGKASSSMKSFLINNLNSFYFSFREVYCLKYQQILVRERWIPIPEKGTMPAWKQDHINLSFETNST